MDLLPVFDLALSLPRLTAAANQQARMKLCIMREHRRHEVPDYASSILASLAQQLVQPLQRWHWGLRR
ncbi:MAG: hypothetical protein CTY16_05165 [Methylobacter sp.]|nr:MAG: hypothetical protein CTY16_05165 [Methylobacter sp.]